MHNISALRAPWGLGVLFKRITLLLRNFQLQQKVLILLFIPVIIVIIQSIVVSTGSIQVMHRALPKYLNADDEEDVSVRVNVNPKSTMASEIHNVSHFQNEAKIKIYLYKQRNYSQPHISGRLSGSTIARIVWERNHKYQNDTYSTVGNQTTMSVTF